MMTKRTRCCRCKRPQSVCYCHTIKEIPNSWPVHILQHPRESGHGIGTAGIAALSLTNCTLQVGDKFTHASLAVDTQKAVLIYPSDDAVSLETLQEKSPQTLIFLDATWRKSHRMLLESPVLQGLPKVGLQVKQLSRYRIRKSKYASSLSTLEAIAHCLSFIENNEEKYSPLLRSMDWMIEKQISLMGEEVFKRNYFK